MSSKMIFLGFLPWIVFSLVAGRGGGGAVATACLVSFALAVALTLFARSRGQAVTLLDVVGMATFAVGGVWAFTSPSSGHFLDTYGPAVATLILAATILVTLPVRPFTEQYARASVPRELWDSPVFHAVNRRISAVWGVAVALMGVASLLSVVVPEYGGHHALDRPVALFLNWIVPAAIVVFAIGYTRHAADNAGGRTQEVAR